MILKDGELRIRAPGTLIDSQVQAYGYGAVTYGQGTSELRPLTIEQPGLYRFEVEATISGGEVFTDEVALLVYDRDQLDALLQANWNAMKARLAEGDIEGALGYYANSTRGDYEAIFTSLEPQLPQIAQQMGPIQMIIAKEGFAKYRLKRSEVHQGQTYEITYPIYFETEANGLWRIVRY